MNVGAANEDTVLLIEDDTNDVLLIRRAFKKAGLPQRLTVVGDGLAAMQYLSGEGAYTSREAHPLPLLVLLDLKLPGRSGHEVLAWLRAQPGVSRTPVVVLTSSKQGLDIDRAYALGANSYLVKPVAAEALQEMISALGVYWTRFNERPNSTPN